MSQKPTFAQKMIAKLPDETKRFLFAVVVFQHCLAGEADKEKLSKLNQELRLTRNDNALEFPSLVYNRFNLFNKPHRAKLRELSTNPEDPSKIATTLAYAVPDWMKYAKTERIAHDIQRVAQQARVTCVA